MKNSHRGTLLPRLGAVVCLVFLAAFAARSQNTLALVGSGSNVPSPLYAVWTEEFNKKNSGVSVRYLSRSTVEGIESLSRGSGDFAAGEIPLSEQQMHGGKVQLTSIPSVIIALVPVYNLPGKPQLRFSGKLLSEIFLGSVKTWKDPRIAKLNPGTSLPDLPVKVVHRTSGKGSNYIFTEFLSKTDPDWKSKVGISPSPAWPVGDEANRGEDMVTKVAASEGAIGYVEASFARHSALGYAEVENGSGEFVRATPASITAACEAAGKGVRDDFRISMTNVVGKDAYPISSFTWLYLPESGLTPERSKALKQFLNWALSDGQEIARVQGYAPLPPSLLTKARNKVNSLP
jgi:phosphate transport system substrate-binding protein